MIVKIARNLLSFICVALVSGANAAEVEPLASWSETVIAIGKPLSAERFNILADAAGVPRASRQDTLRKFNITDEESGSERMFFVREGGSPKRTDIGFLEGKPEGFGVYLMNQRGDLKWAGRGNEDEGYVPTPLRDAREPFAVELGFWRGFEESYNELNAVTEDGSRGRLSSGRVKARPGQGQEGARR